jgi:DNA-binding NtrC family response regulator
MHQALIVDVDRDARTECAGLARSLGFQVRESASLADGRARLIESMPDVLVLDSGVVGPEALAPLLDELSRVPKLAVVLTTREPRLETAIEALRHGVMDYIRKPGDLDRLALALGEVARRPARAAVSEAAAPERPARVGGLVSASTAMQRVCGMIERVAPSGATVIVSGESGTGKDVVARTLHDLSRRSAGPFEAVNCGAIAPSLMESELFGHERGSFTGADRRHRGCFERASGGTLFLDEVTEMPPDLQVKLLRILETGEFTRVGGEAGMATDARMIAATNRNVREALSDGTLREDLYYRLKVFQIDLPPLRERMDDVEPLVDHFLERLQATEGVRKVFDPAAIDALRSYTWPGNIRELRNAVQSGYILTEDRVIDVDALPPEVRHGRAVGEGDSGGDHDFSPQVGRSLADIERQMIEATLLHHGGNKAQAAKDLGISLKTLYTRLHEYGRM